MKKFFTKIVFLLAVVFSIGIISANAQTPPYYSVNVTGSGNTIPFYNNASGTWAKGEFRMAPNFFGSGGTGVGSAPAGQISSVWFKVANAGGTATFTNFEILIGHSGTTVSSSTTFTTGLTSCFSAASHTINFPGLNQWIELPLTTPFTYDPNQTLVVTVRHTARTGAAVSVTGDNISGIAGTRRGYGTYAGTTMSTLASYGAAIGLSLGCTSTITPTAPAAICEDNINNTVQLTGGPVGGGTWSTASTLATVDGTGLVSGAAGGAGSATITYTDPGCTPVNQAVTVNPIPVITATPVAPEHCLGDSVALTAADVPTSPTTSTQFFWSHGLPNGAFITSTNNTLYIVESNDANGCKSDPYNVTVQVNPNPTITASGNTACENDASVTLSSSGTGGTGALSYLWTGPAPATTAVAPAGPSPTVAISPVALTDAGVYEVTVTDTKTCSATATATLVVNTQPVITLVSPSTAAICADGTTQLATTATGGTWASLTPGVASVDAAGLVTAASAGTADITYTDGNGCVGTFTVTVNSLPVLATPIVSPVCVGSPAQALSMSNPPAAPVAWVSSMPAVASVTPDNAQNTTLNNLTAGTSTITYTDINGCTATSSITVSPVPVIGPATATAVCVGSTLQLTSTTAGTNWTTSNPAIATVSSTGLVTGVSISPSNIVLINFTDANNCAAVLPQIVTVNPVPTITSTVTDVCVNSTITLTASSATGTWSSSNANASVGATTGDVTGLLPGTADIIYTDLNGCTVTQQVLINPIPPMMITATPNPTCIGSDVILSATPALAPPPPPPVYCGGTTPFANNTNYINITSFTFAGVTTSSPNALGFYTDNTSTVIPVTAGTGFSTAVTKGNTVNSTNYQSWWNIWIDLNQDGDFTDPGEEILSVNQGTPIGSSQSATTLPIPTTAFNGQTRMRVTVGMFETSSMSPCGNFATWGESEDFTIDISGGSPYVAPPPSGPTYCTSTATTPNEIYIPQTNINGVVTTEANPGGPGSVNRQYMNHTAIVIPVTAGTSFPLTVNKGDASGSNWGAAVKAWVDLNQDGDFTDAGEEVYAANAPNLGPQPTANITLPTSALDGQTRMRITMEETSVAGVVPCQTFTWGETEDYTLDISGGVPPPPPVGSSLTCPGLLWTPATNLTSQITAVTTAVGMTANTVYTVTGCDANGCSATSSVSIVVNPLPTISGLDSVVCVGNQITFTASTTGTWSTSNANATVVAGVVTGVAGGSVDIIFTDGNGCQDTRTIDVKALPFFPQPPNLVLCNGATDSVTFIPTFNTYTWTNSDPSIGVAASGTGDIPSFTGINTGTTPVVSTVTVIPTSSGTTADTFTSAGVTGQFGPSQAQVDAAYAGTPLAGNVTVTGGIQYWTVPSTGTYTIEAIGAQGYGPFGGRGASMKGDFTLTGGTVLKLLVGQEAGLYWSSATNQFGGGGGSFVATNTNTPLIIAGGGGGNHASSFITTADAQITNSGGSGTGGASNGSGGTAGNGGNSASSADGGGGFNSDGGGTTGGDAFVNGGNGGFLRGHGGFGGGGGTSSWNNFRAGGGGGYSGGGGSWNGGNCCPRGGGGGSFNSGTNQVNTAGIGLGDGMIVITSASAAPGVTCPGPPVTFTITVNPSPVITGPFDVCLDPLATLPLTANNPPLVTPPQVVQTFNEGFYAASSTTTAFVPNPNTPGWTSSGPGNWRSDYNGVSTSYGPSSGRTDAGYVYLDASYTGDDTLISPIIDLTAEVAPIDLSFYTFMYTVSGTIADLDLFVDNGPGTATSASLFNVSGNQQSSQSDPWDQRTVSLDAYAGQQIRLKFRGERGTSSITDIALDDVEIFTYTPPTIADSWSSSDPLVATIDSNGLVTPISSGTTDITYTDVNGCSSTETVTVNDLPLVTAVADSNEICDGESTVLTASQTLGAAPIQWFWSHGQGNGATLTPTGGNNINYTVFATDANGCSSLPVTIGVIVNPTPTITAADQTVCDGQGTATFVGIPAGGTPPYLTPTWAPNLTSTATAIIDNTPFTATLADAGDYVVTVEDAKGCLSTDTATLFVDPLPAAPTAAAVSSPVCFGADAVFTITGVAGYDYEYNFDGGTTMTASIATGTTVNVTNPAPLTNTTLNITKVTNTLTGCVTDLSITPVTAIVNVTLLPATPTITTNANTTTGNVCSLSTAIFTINGTNGDLVDWNTIGTGGAISGTATIGATGTVDVSVPGMVSTTNITLTQVTGTGGCFNTINVMASIGVDILPVLAVGATTPASCSPGCDGTAAITVSTAPAISSYSISPSVSAAMNGSIAENLCAATNYTITATDIYGCMGTVAHTGTLAPNPTVTATGDVICIGDQATLTAAGTNTAPTGPGFTYAWAGPAPGNANTSTANPYNLTPALSTEAGTYMVTATDAAGCTAQTTVTLTINELPSVTTVVTTQPSCIPGSDGVITATGAASTSPGSGASFTYALNPPSTFGPSNVFSSLSAGIYTIAVTDGNGCTNTISQTLNTANGPAVTSTNSPTICELDATTFTTVATPGLNPTLTYSYSPIPSSGPIVNGTAFTPLLSEAGAYIVTVTDGNGCTAVGLHALTINATPTITGSLVLCGGDIEQLTGSGTPATTNAWVSSDPLVATVDANGLVTATLLGGTTDITYYETANGITCDVTQTITVNVKPIIAGPTEVCRLADINLSATAAGTWSSLNMTVATVDATGKVTGVAAGMADIVLVDANGCSDTFTVTVNPLPEIMATAVPYEICAGDTTTLTAMNTVTSPSTAINFFWTHSGPNPSLQAPAFNTTYFVFASDANGCSSSSVSQLVQVNQLPTITASDVTICDGDLATLTATAANTSPTIGAVTIAWTGAFTPITNGLAFGPLLSQAGLYTATATDSKGCTNATTVNLFIDTLPTAPTLTSNSPICDGQDAVFTLTGVANDVVTYSINGGTPATATIGAGGTVDVTVTGVSVDQMISLTEVQSPATSCITPLSSTMTVMVQPLPTAATVAGNSPICDGDDAVFTLSGDATDIVTYTINGSLPATATIGALGTVDVTVTAASVDQTILLTQVEDGSTGCITPLTATTTITVNPNPVAATVASNSPICDGADAIFTITGTATDMVTYTINAGTPAMATIGALGTVDVTVTAASVDQTMALTEVQDATTGCTTALTATTTVTVNPNPAAPVLTSNSPICDGDDAIFTISGTATDIVTYSINGGTPTTATIGALGTVDVTVTAASVDQTITLSQVQDATTNCTTALTETMTVTVNPNPVVVTVASNTPICSGFDAIFTLTGTANDVVTYSINAGPAQTATIGALGTVDVSVLGATVAQTITLSQVQSGSTGCTTALTGTTTVAINPNPVISGNSVVCSNLPVQLSATNLPAASGAWMSSDTLIATVDNNGLVSTPGSGAVDITYTDINGCIDRITITVNPLPIITSTATPFEICYGDSSELTATTTLTSPTTAINFFWTHGLVNSSYLSPIANTTYFVYGTDANGCSSSSVSQLVQVNQLPSITASDVTICVGASATLTATAASTAPTTGTPGIAWSGTFTPVNNGVAFIPAVADSGPYTATATDSKGCENSTTVNLTVNPLPAAPAITNNSPICDGSNAVFTLTGSVGDLVSYTINGTSAAIATIGAGGTVDVTATGVSVDQTILLSQVQSGGTGCVTSLSATSTVTVQPLPTAATISSNSPICDGADAVFTITGTATDIVTYTINSGTPTTATIGGTGTVDITVTAASVDQTMVLSQVQNATTGCTSALTATTTITVNALPTVIANTSAQVVCAGDSVTLTGSGASTYTWDNSVVDGAAFVPAATTTYTVTGTDGNGCINTSTVSVAVNALPTVVANTTDTVVCAGDMVTLTGSGASTYAWDNSVVDGTAFAPAATTTYTVTGTDGNGCMNTSTVSVAVNALPAVAANATATDICAGDMVALAGGATTVGITYTWDNSVVDATPFSPAATNTYTVTGTDGNGCSATSSVTVTVNAIPVAPTVSVTHPICATDSGTINVSAPLGANYEYSVDGINYQSSPNFTVLAGNYSVTVKDITSTASCPSLATMDTIQANATPCGPNVAVGAQSLPTSIAEGGTATINYFVSNVGTAPTSGVINIIISKPSNGTLTLTPPAGWTITLNTSGSVFLQSTNVIQPGLTNRITIPAVYVHDSTNEDAVKSSNIKAQAGSGSEVITNDNEGQTFIQIN